MERSSYVQENERPINNEEREYLQRVLGSFGLVDALLCDQPETVEHLEDRRWAVLDYNPCIERGRE